MLEVTTDERGGKAVLEGALPTFSPSTFRSAALQLALRHGGTVRTDVRKHEGVIVQIREGGADVVPEGEQIPELELEFTDYSAVQRKVAVILKESVEFDKFERKPGVDEEIAAQVDKALAAAWEAQIMGLGVNGAALDTPSSLSFSFAQLLDEGRYVVLGDTPDALRRAVSAAAGRLEEVGLDPNGVILGTDARQAIRDGRRASDGSTDLLYPTNEDPLLGLDPAYTRNIAKLGTEVTSGVAIKGVVGDFSQLTFVSADTVDVLANPYREAHVGKLETRYISWGDLVRRDPGAFCLIVDGEVSDEE